MTYVKYYGILIIDNNREEIDSHGIYLASRSTIRRSRHPHQQRTGPALLSSIQRELENKIRQRGFPAVVTMDEVKSGGGLFAQKLPMLVIRHPNPPFKYREVGVIVNGDWVTFPLWGRDVQEERQRNKNGFGLVASLVLPGRNEFQAQNERAWAQTS